jgi:small subunit ribosomal protein S6
MVMILSPEATQDEVAATVERVDGLISGGGGAVMDHEMWGLKRLAYEINDFNEGNYVLTRFSLDANGVSELNRALNASEDIVRFLVTRQEIPTPEVPEEADDSKAAEDAGPASEAGPAPEAAADPGAESTPATEAPPAPVAPSNGEGSE